MDLLKQIKFDEKGLIPAIVQDVESGEVLMLAYMNKDAVQKSMETGRAHYWSRSRQKLWMKGESSGHIQIIQEAYFDCDKDTLLLKVKQTTAACHTGNYSCFFNKIDENCGIIEESNQVFSLEEVYSKDAAILQELYQVVVGRRENPKEGSYTTYLFEKGLDKILKKVGEESAEVIIASKNRSKEEVSYEVSDLFYHIIVLLVEQGVSLEEIYAELKKRR